MEISYDTIPVIDQNHFVCIESPDLDEIIFSLIKKEGKNFQTLISKVKTGAFMDTILIKDYDFDGIKDFDFVTRPACRSGANTNHHIYLKKGEKFIKTKIPPHSYLTPNFAEKRVYGIYYGNCDFELVKAKWEGINLKLVEQVDINCIGENKEYHATTYQFINDEEFKIKEEIISQFPNNYTKTIANNDINRN